MLNYLQLSLNFSVTVFLVIQKLLVKSTEVKGELHSNYTFLYLSQLANNPIYKNEFFFFQNSPFTQYNIYGLSRFFL